MSKKRRREDICLLLGRKLDKLHILAAHEISYDGWNFDIFKRLDIAALFKGLAFCFENAANTNEYGLRAINADICELAEANIANRLCRS